MVKLENAIQSSKFKNAKHKAGINVLYSAWWLKTIMSREMKEVGLTHEQYNVLRILKGKYPEELCVRDIGCRMIDRLTGFAIWSATFIKNNFFVAKESCIA